MIASSPFTVNIASISDTDGLYDLVVAGLENNPYNQNDGFGFSTETLEPNYISAYLILSNPITVSRYDNEVGDVVNTEVNEEKLVPFRLDFEENLLEIYSSQSDTSHVITRVSELINWSTSITETGLQMSGLYSTLQESNLDIEITSMHISDFKYNSIRGNYHLKSFDASDAESLLEEYNKNISYLCITAKKRNEEATFGFYRSGSIRLYSKTESDEEFWKEMKDAISHNMGEV